MLNILSIFAADFNYKEIPDEKAGQRPAQILLFVFEDFSCIYLGAVHLVVDLFVPLCRIHIVDGY